MSEAQPSEYSVGNPHTIEHQAKIFARRERSVEMRALGYSYEEIRKKEGVSWRTSYNDVRHHLEHCARYYSTAQNREQIAESFRSTQRQADAMLKGLCTETLCGEEGEAILPDSIEAKELRLKCLQTIQKAASGLALLYGFSGEKSFFLNVPTTPGEGLMGKDQEWIKGLSPSVALKMRDKIIELHALQFEPAAVPAEFTVDETPPAPEVAPPPPVVENGHATNGDDDGPVTLKGG